MIIHVLVPCVQCMVAGQSGQAGQTAALLVEMEHSPGTVLVPTLPPSTEEGTVKDRDWK